MRLFRRKTPEFTPLTETRFAVVDCETTGLFPGGHHRIVELAVVQLDGVDNRVGEWSTLLNPGRDLGDASVHGIRGADVRNAPSFEDVVGSVLDLLADRVVVAHNARFDCAFLEAELARAGYDVAPLPRLCTIELLKALGADGASLRLADCCQAHGISVDGEHRAAADAHLCAELLREYARRAAELGLPSLEGLGWGPPSHRNAWPRAVDRAAPLPREQTTCVDGGNAEGEIEKPFLSSLVARRGTMRTEVHTATAYADLLDRALEDRRLSESERRDLLAAAELYDLSGAQLKDLHDQYLDLICAVALADGVVTERERYDLQLVAELLGVDDLDERLERIRADGAPENPALADSDSGREDLRGLSVCFTGKLLCSYEGQQLTRERACELAESAGLVVATRVTKSLDLLVVADPETTSGKARKAREYGTRIMAETEFWRKLGIQVY